MRTLPLAAWIVLAGCTQNGSTSSPALQPPPGTGVVIASLVGTWEVSNVVVDEARFAGPPGTTPLPGIELQPPLVGDRIQIDPTGFVSSGARPLQREECERGGSIVGGYTNRVGSRFAVYDLECHTKTQPGIVDGGSNRLQMAFGTVTPDRLLGQILFDTAGAPIPAGTPVHGLFTVQLTRVP